ncbi:uncharacterized protein LOC115545419 isoform X3 [Gadus morhua]|uniref:uncharacterized protein LOC115545419 isoform X3 n=1 Tax=Gadus morhua TaxID=8049 RepID=UPI0011B750F0|nr:uncharacterized protein LOC115545419 isoform X3 [Gadus morhua]
MTGSWRIFLLCLLQGAGCNAAKYPGVFAAPRLMTPKEKVVEGTPVELRCSAPSYSQTHPPTVTWTSALGLSTQLQQDDTVTSTLTFNASHLYHGNNVSCTAAYYIPSGNKTVTSTRYQLSILYAPRNTSAVGSPCLPASEGGCLNLTCSSHANPAVSEFTWYRIHGEHIFKIGSGSSLSIQLLSTNNWFFCVVRNDIGIETSNIYKIDIQDVVLCIFKSAVMFVGLVSVVVCFIRTRKVSEETRSFNAATVKRAPPDEEESQVVFGGEEDIYVNSGMQMNLVGPREEPVGPREEAVLRAGSPVSTHRDAASSQLTEDTQTWKMGEETRSFYTANVKQAPPDEEESQVVFGSEEDVYVNSGMQMNPVGPREEPVGPREEAVLRAGSPVSTHRDAASSQLTEDTQTWKMGEETRSFYTANVKRAPPDEEESQVVFGGEEDVYVNSGMQMNPVGPREEPVGPREEAVLRDGSPVSTHRDAASSHRIDPAGSHPGRPVSRELTEDTQTRNVAEEARSFNAATVKQAPPDEEESQVLFGGEEDIYVNSGMQMNPVGPREEPVRPREEAVLRAGSPVSTHRDAASSGRIGPAGSHPGRPVTRELTEDTQTRKVAEEARSFNAATVKQAPPDEEESQVVFGGEEDIYINSGMQMNPVGPREEPVGPREEAVLRAGSPVSTHRDAASSRLIGPAGSHPGRPVSRELTEDTQ